MCSSNGLLKLFVGDIGDNRKSDLSRVFSKYGEISTIYVDEHKHFAFIEFTSSTDAQRALQRTNNKTVNGSKLRVEYAKPDKTSRDSRRPLTRVHSPPSTFYDHLQVTANRLPTMQSMRQNYYQHHPSTMMSSSTMSRGRSLTPPSFKQNARISSMNHLRSQEFYPPYYPHHPAVYSDPAYYRAAYGDPYLMQRLPPPPPTAFFPPTSPPPSSSSSRSHRNMYSSSGLDRYPPVMSHRRSQRSRSRSRRRTSPSRKTRSSRESKRKRRISTSSSPKNQRDRGPQTPPTSSHRSRKRSRSGSDTVASTSEQKTSSTSSSDDENNEIKQSNSKRSKNSESNQKHLKRKTRE
ncbi:unnamed protein product [Adineta steineri]|uniref:RRM domain-containing protein n=1 Tax=Adineta steineri TaxID=433720 RepID=A0A814ZX67_9BILA|nr:unnamed protein product [Adineta steineri]CAF1038216.1 unnamed protein product [Adineta steineri]CAF1247459.1 unnamed protein product [Adineta steineri]CAF1531882.1 unnamed protein product [Adineta steineri]